MKALLARMWLWFENPYYRWKIRRVWKRIRAREGQPLTPEQRAAIRVGGGVGSDYLTPEDTLRHMASADMRAWAGLGPNGMPFKLDSADTTEPWSDYDARNDLAKMGGDRWHLARQLLAAREALECAEVITRRDPQWEEEWGLICACLPEHQERDIPAEWLGDVRRRQERPDA